MLKIRVCMRKQTVCTIVNFTNFFPLEDTPPNVSFRTSTRTINESAMQCGQEHICFSTV